MTQTTMTASWNASEAFVSLLPNSCVLWVDDGLDVKATPKPLRASTTATKAPNRDMILLGGNGAQYGT